jgi:hypothetical protein
MHRNARHSRHRFGVLTRESSRPWVAVSVVLLCLTISSPHSAWAQLYSGSLSGVVSDPSGAVVPAAKITLTDAGKGFVSTATTDEVGRYLLRPLPPSTYRLTVEAPGFKTYVRDALVLDVSENATIDVRLELGLSTQSVEVVGTAPLLNLQDAVTGQEVNRAFINDLPLVSRGVFNLATLTPGVSQPGLRSFSLDTLSNNYVANNFVSNGGRNATADILIDGLSTTDYEQNTSVQNALYTPSVDAVQEFKVQQSNFSAEVGFSGATLLNVVTRSGTNSFHGSVYEFLRNQALDANNWFNNANSVPLPPLRLNQFGFTVGGPIHRDRTFFFFDYEGTRMRTLSTQWAGVPSAAMRAGDFGEICAPGFDSSGLCLDEGGQLWDPYSGVYVPEFGGPLRTAFIPFNNLATYQSPGNPKLDGTGYQLPAAPGNLIDPVAYRMMQFYPPPNVAVGTPQYDRFNNWIGSGVNKASNDQWDLKIDHRFNDRDLLSARFSWGRGRGRGASCFHNLADPCSTGSSIGPRVLALNLVHTFSPSTLLNISYGIARNLQYSPGPAADFPDFDPVTTLGMPEYIKRSGIVATPAIIVWGGYASASGLSSVGMPPYSAITYGQETHHFLATLNRMQGRHELKFGGEMRMHRISHTQPGPTAGWFWFDYATTSEYPWWGGGDAMAGFLIGGGPGSGGYYEIPSAASTQSFRYAGHLQDNWRVTERLTVNLGLRYELEIPRTERFNHMSWIDPDVVSPLQVPGLSLRGGLRFADEDIRAPFNTDGNNFGPRVGLAYRLTDRTALRAGYGLFYCPTEAGVSGSGYAGFTQGTSLLNTYQNDGATPWGRLSDPWPITGPKLPPGSSLGLMTNVGFDAWAPIRTWNATPYEQTWSLGIQRELPGGVLVDAAYVGKKGTKLYFGGAGYLSHLGPEVLDWSEAEIEALFEFVPNPFFGIITDPVSSLSYPEIQRWVLQRPYPQFSSFAGSDPTWANSIYHAFQLRVERRLSKGLQFLVTYTNSKSIDNASVSGLNVTWLGGSVDIQDLNRLYLERSLSQFDIAQVLQLSYIYQLPWGRGKRWGSNWNPWLDGFLGGWQTNGIWRFDNGQPFPLGLSGGQSIPTYGQRPNLTAALKRNKGKDWMDQYFANPEVAVVPPPWTLGTASRVLPNIRVPGTNVAALSLFKEIPLSRLREGARLEYRVEAFNAFNHPQFCGPDATVNGPSFGKVTCQANSPREVQMALKFYW